MKLQIDKFYENKTRRFLLPVLSAYGNDFKLRFDRVYKFAVGVHDMTVQGHPMTKESLIYIMIDKKFKPQDAISFINWLQGQDYYVEDYVSGSELDSRKHMLVVRVPDEFKKAYTMFLMGRYSEMYTEEQKKVLFSENHRKKALGVLNKTEDALKDYCQQVNSLFEYQLKPQDMKDHNEYSLPNFCEQEVFNYKKGDKVFFNEEYSKAWIELATTT